MKSVSSHPLLIELFGQGIVIDRRRVAAMEGRVEASYLRKLGTAGQQHADRRKIVGLMQGRERNVTLEPGHDIRGNKNGAVVGGAAMYDAVSDREETHVLALPQPVRRDLDSGGQVRNFVRREVAVDQGTLACVLRPHPWFRSDTVDLPLYDAIQPSPSIDREHLKFEAGRTRVHDQDRIHGSDLGNGLLAPPRIGINHSDGAG